jgi:hypothetical protein
MDALAADVDPDERVAPFVVDCALADVRGVEDQIWSSALPQWSAAEWRSIFTQPILRNEEIDNLLSYWLHAKQAELS